MEKFGHKVLEELHTHSKTLASLPGLVEFFLLLLFFFCHKPQERPQYH
jgi:hypothetical protein